MGLQLPKSSIKVKDGKTFLDLTFEQIQFLNKTYSCSVPLLLMNSTNTESAAKEAAKTANIEVLCFNQSNYPRLDASTYLPLVDFVPSPSEYWYPPGHGNVYDALYRSGLLHELLRRGIEILFISNIDNLGATLDISLLYSFVTCSADVAVEVTAKTSLDIKGGSFIKYILDQDSGCFKYKDLECAEVPQDHLSEFQSGDAFRFFNTGNLWVKLPFLSELLKTDRLKLDVIQNFKWLNKRKIVQLETAAGSIVSHSNDVIIIEVQRTRFMPVKTCTDLLRLMSNLYVWDRSEACLMVSPLRSIPSLPEISLNQFYLRFDDFIQRFPFIPDITQLESLTIDGDVCFSSGIQLVGKIVIHADDGNKLMLPENTILSNVIVRGTLVILKYDA